MANGPGARIVDRVGVLVLPDTSKFQPALKKYLDRLSRSMKVEVGVDFDDSGLKRDADAAAKAASGGAKVKASADLSDGFLSQMQRDVTAAMRQIEADVPLTADGERLRREARSKVAALQSQMADMALAVPLDPEAGAAQKADLKAEIAELQAIASRNEVEIPVDTDRRGAGFTLPTPSVPSFPDLAMVVGAAGLLTAALGAIPAIMSSIAAPLGTIVLGWEGIAQAAREARPGFEALQSAVESQFASDLAPTFASLGAALPQLIPAFQGLASALSGAFGEAVSALVSPEGLAKVDGIIRNITEAVEILSPVLGPMVDAFLDFALVGTQSFVDNAPALNNALGIMTDLFRFLAESGILGAAVDGFSALVTGALLLAGVIGGTLIVTMATFSSIIRGVVGALEFLWGAFQATVPIVTGFGLKVLEVFTTLPLKILGALAVLPAMLFGFFTGLWSKVQAATNGGAGRLVGIFLTLPARILAAIAALPAMLIGLITRAFSGASGSASGGVSRLVGIFLTLPVRALAAIAALPAMLIGLISRAFSGMTSNTSGGVGRVVGIFATLPARALAAIAALPAMLIGVISRAFSGMTSNTTGGVGRVVGIIATLPARALGVIAALPMMLMGVITDAFGRMAGAASGGIANVVGIISGLGASIVGAIAGIPGQLYNAGASMMSSLASGIRSKISSVTAAAASAAGGVAGFFPGSPVKEGPLTAWNHGDGVSGAGRRLIGDLAAGMQAERSAAARAARGVAGSIAAPIAGVDPAVAGAAGLGAMSKSELIDALYRGTYAGSSQQQRDVYARTATKPRGRTRG